MKLRFTSWKGVIFEDFLLSLHSFASFWVFCGLGGGGVKPNFAAKNLMDAQTFLKHGPPGLAWQPKSPKWKDADETAFIPIWALVFQLSSDFTAMSGHVRRGPFFIFIPMFPGFARWAGFSKPNMTGRRFHRTMEIIPARLV